MRDCAQQLVLTSTSCIGFPKEDQTLTASHLTLTTSLPSLSHRGFRVIKHETKTFAFDKPGVSAIAAPSVYQPVA